MKIHEYQAKELFRRYGIAVPSGRVAHSVDEAVGAVRAIVEESGNPVVVVKSQIHAGGRGKGGVRYHPDVTLEEVLALSAAAAVTSRIGLATNIAIGPLRSPALLAKHALSVDALSNGRFTLGLGSQVKAHVERRYGARNGTPNGARNGARAGS